MDHSATSDFMAHGFCFLWEPRLVWLHVLSDILTGITYYSITIALFFFAYKRRDIPFLRIFILFGVFIFACGTTHLFAAYTIYVPAYWYEGMVKATTAVVSIISAFLFIPLIPRAIAMPSLTKAFEEIKGLNERLSKELEERRATEKALFTAEKKYKTLLEDVHMLAIMLDNDGNITFCNDYLLRLTGWTRDEVINRNWFDLFLPNDVRETVYAVFSSGIKDNALALHYENPIMTREGIPKLIVWDNSILRDTEGNIIGMASLGTDVTEHRKLEEQLRQSQKMEGIGQLAGGIAHDFNNILSSIVGYGHLTLMKMADDDPNRLNVENILEASDKAAHLTKDLLLFSRKQAIDRKPLDLNETIRRLQKFLIRVIGEDIICDARLSEGRLMLSADTHQLEQVLMNLATNARDAMPKGGTFTITTKEIQLDEEFTSTCGLCKAGRYALISISDTGYGMDNETSQKIFEPFFTTKEVGKGTGLGLAVAYGIIRQHEGNIMVNSTKGKGTTIRIYLPLMSAVQEDGGSAIAGAEEQPVAGGTETILVAEDEESLRKLNHSVLTQYGYTVIDAVDGVDAVNRFKEHKDSIQLLLFDLIMPKMNGSEAFDKIRKINPDIKVIFASGYSPDIVRQKVLLDEDAELIYKPISPFELLRKVREVLDKGKR
ncbi:MAG: response regulator [Nitrospirae bacterium]|nr:response regulator [Nitrospirota bacterium]